MKLVRQIKNLIETNKSLSSSFDLIASTSLYQKLIQKRIKKITSNLKKSKNYNIIIETTNFCNARCIMCPHVSMKRSTKNMDDLTFNKIINQIQKEGINPNAFILNGFGEPLIDPKIIDRIKLIKKEFPNSKIKFYSNLNLANKTLVRKIIRSGLDEINISLNGYDAKSYQQVMKINYKKTIENLKNLIKFKKEIGADIKIRISMTLVKQNEKTVQKFIKRWAPKVDSVSVNKVHDYNGSVHNINDKFKINFKKIAFPCRYLWDTIIINVDGEIGLCCLDYESQYKFGNIKSQQILKSFYSPKFESIRKQHLQLKSKDIKICSQCYTPYKNGVEWLINKLY